eukprot:6326490-Lingulodinium_polyedra.AAC.1
MRPWLKGPVHSVHQGRGPMALFHSCSGPLSISQSCESFKQQRHWVVHLHQGLDLQGRGVLDALLWDQGRSCQILLSVPVQQHPG